MCLIAFAMFSTAMRRKPSAIACGVRSMPVAERTSCASASNFARTTSLSSGSSPPAPNSAGKSSGSSLPTITLQSVTVSGPPRRYEAGPGFAPADCGPTRKRAPSNVQIDPPPAATVWMRIIGARNRTPATSVTNARSYSPAQCVTSVDVPPMSKPMIRSNPASRDTSTAPTMPPAGPDRIASLPWNRCASVKPPDDCMNCKRNGGQTTFSS